MMNKFEMCKSCKQELTRNLSEESNREFWHDPRTKLPLEGQAIRFEPMLKEGLGRALLPTSYKGVYKNGKFRAIVWRLRASVFIEYRQFVEGENRRGYQHQELSKGPNLIYRWIEL